MGSIPQNPRGVIDLRVILTGKSPEDVANLIRDASTTHGELLRKQMAAIVSSGADGLYGVDLVARAQGVTYPMASGSFTVTAADLTVGDKLVFHTASSVEMLTAVAADANPFLGQFAGATDDDLAASIRLAINCYAPVASIAEASGATDEVVVTSKIAGQVINNGILPEGTPIVIAEQVTNSGVFSFNTVLPITGGLSEGTTAVASVEVLVNPVALDTLRFGTVLLTWAAAAANENEITIGAGTDESAANLAAVINAHSILGGLMTASADASLVTLASEYFGLEISLLHLESSDPLSVDVPVDHFVANGDGSVPTFTASSALASTVAALPAQT